MKLWRPWWQPWKRFWSQQAMGPISWKLDAVKFSEWQRAYEPTKSILAGLVDQSRPKEVPTWGWKWRHLGRWTQVTSLHSGPSILLNLALWRKTTVFLCMESLQGPSLWLAPCKMYNLLLKHATASRPKTGLHLWRATMQYLSLQEISTNELPRLKCVHRIQQSLWKWITNIDTNLLE